MMRISQRAIVRNAVRGAKAACALTLALTWGVAESYAAPTFFDTTNNSQWQVAATLHGNDAAPVFPTSGFTTATAVSRTTDGVRWIANNADGTNGGVGQWTFFVFQQTFDLTGYNPTGATLQFQWAADDSGQVFADRGSWTPKYSLNGGGLVAGSWPGNSSYGFGPTVTLNSGFVSGLNTIRFYVEGNGQTDGMALKTISFTAAPVPEPETYAMMLAGFGLMGMIVRRRKSV